MIREFRLYNHDMSRSISLSNDFVYATNPKGLGSRFNLSRHNDLIYKVESNFEPITMNLNFLRKPYETYNIFKNFIYGNGDNRFVFAYNYKKPNTTAQKTFSGFAHTLTYPINLSKIWIEEYQQTTKKLIYDKGVVEANYEVTLYDAFHENIFRIQKAGTGGGYIDVRKNGVVSNTLLYDEVVVEYTTEDNFIYCDCYVESLSKTEKTTYNVLTETLVLNRLTMWYDIETITYQDNLSFTTDPIINNFTKPFPVKIMYQSSYENWFEIEIEDVCVIDVNNVKTIIIDPEAKTVKDFDGNNIYSALDQKDNSFMHIPKGTHQIKCDDFANQIGTRLVLIIKKWLAD